MLTKRRLFSIGDANAILATNVPQQQVADRVVWSKSNDGVYSVKTGYREWQNQVTGSSLSMQSAGWNRLWRLALPHKIKIFVWRLCRDNIPVRIRPRNKGVDVPIMCPFCNVDIEHLLHLFFDCRFATSYWQAANMQYDMREEESAPQWVLNKLETAKHEEVTGICVVLWGIWYWRNQRVWHNKSMNPAIAMDNSFKMLSEWKAVRKKVQVSIERRDEGVSAVRRWQPPKSDSLKLNVDASFFPEATSFTIGMVIRDHEGKFIEGRTMFLTRPDTVFEAECIRVREALSWIMSY